MFYVCANAKEAVDLAMKWLDGKNNKQKPISAQTQDQLFVANAAIFDIDDTIVRSDRKRTCVLCPEIKKLYEKILKKGWNVFFVTARPEDPENRKFTLDQLHKLGFHQHEGLYMMPAKYAKSPNFSAYKHDIRTKLAKQGFKFGINIGDNWNDLILMPPYVYKKGHYMNQMQDDILKNPLLQNESKAIILTNMLYSALSIKLPFVPEKKN